MPAVRLSANARNVQSTVGETLTITVPITGAPTPTVKWFKNGQMVSASKKVCFASDNIIVVEPQRMQLQIYMCTGSVTAQS